MARKDCFEFFIAEHVITLCIVLLNDCIYLGFCQLLAEFLHGKIDIIVSDLSCVVGIKLLENSLKLLLCNKISHVYGSCEKITIIYLFVSIIIEL